MLPRELAFLLLHGDLGRRHGHAVQYGELQSRKPAQDIRGPWRHIHVAGAHALHHDAGPAGCGEEEVRSDKDQEAALLFRAGPSRKSKMGIIEMFPNSKLYEAYGSTEAGIVTILKPHEQLNKLGSIGREVIGTDIIQLYDEDGNLVTKPNVVGELYPRSPMLFEGYWKA